MEITKKMKSGLKDWIYWKAEKASPWDEAFEFGEAGMYAKEFASGELFGYLRAAAMLKDMPEGATMKDYEDALAKEVAFVTKVYTLNDIHNNSNWVTQVQLKGKSEAMITVMHFAAAMREN